MLAISASTLADSTRPAARSSSRRAVRSSGSDSAASCSLRFSTTSNGRSVSSPYPFRRSRFRASVESERSGRSSSNVAFIDSKTAISAAPRFSFFALSSLRSTMSRSARMHSAWKASSSPTGSASDSRAAFGNARMTKQITSCSRIGTRALRDSPFFSAPCSPGMSEKMISA